MWRVSGWNRPASSIPRTMSEMTSSCHPSTMARTSGSTAAASSSTSRYGRKSGQSTARDSSHARIPSSFASRTTSTSSAAVEALSGP